MDLKKLFASKNEEDIIIAWEILKGLGEIDINDIFSNLVEMKKLPEGWDRVLLFNIVLSDLTYRQITNAGNVIETLQHTLRLYSDGIAIVYLK